MTEEYWLHGLICKWQPFTFHVRAIFGLRNPVTQKAYFTKRSKRTTVNFFIICHENRGNPPAVMNHLDFDSCTDENTPVDSWTFQQAQPNRTTTFKNTNRRKVFSPISFSLRCQHSFTVISYWQEQIHRFYLKFLATRIICSQHYPVFSNKNMFFGGPKDVFHVPAWHWRKNVFPRPPRGSANA